MYLNNKQLIIMQETEESVWKYFVFYAQVCEY